MPAQEAINGGFVNDDGTPVTGFEEDHGTIQPSTDDKFKKGGEDAHIDHIQNTSLTESTEEQKNTKSTTSQTTTTEKCEEQVESVLKWLSDAFARVITGSVTINEPNVSLSKQAENLDNNNVSISITLPKYSGATTTGALVITVANMLLAESISRQLTSKEGDFVRSEIAKLLCETTPKSPNEYDMNDLANLSTQWASLDTEQKLSILNGMVGIED